MRKVLWIIFTGILLTGMVDTVMMNTAAGEDWRTLGKDESGTEHFYDQGSIRHLQNDMVSVWTKNEQTKDEKGKYSYQRTLNYVDCPRKKVCVRSVTAVYDGKEKPIDYPYGEWCDFLQGSVYNALYDAVCRDGSPLKR